MRMSSLWAAERRIALAALVVLSAFSAVASSASAAPVGYDATVATGSPLVYFKLDEGVGASTAVNAGSLGSSADGAYRNVVRNRRSAAIACERRTSWFDSGGLNPAYETSACAARGDLPGYSAYFSGAPYNPQVAASQVQESLSYTLEAWIKPTTASSSGGIIDHGDNGVLALENGVLTFIAHATDGNAVATDDAALSINAWHHVVGTWDNATGTARLYVDGAPAGGPNDTATANPLGPFGAAGSPTLYVGWTNQDGAGSFTGYIDNPAYYGSVLSPATIATHNSDGSFNGGGARVTALTPEPGSTFSTASTKWASTFLDYTCANTGCTYTITGPGGPYNGTSGAGTTVHTALPNGGAGSYTITVTDGGYVARSSYTIGTFSGVITNDGPTAWYRFDEPDGVGIAADSAAGNLHPGAYQNASQNGGIGISGDASAAREFLDGDGGYVGVNGVDAFPQSYTIEMWFKTSDSGDMALFDHGAHGGGPALYLEGGAIKYRTVDGQILTAPYTSGTWTHVAATWDGVTAALYKDGSQADAKTVTLSPSGTPALYLGFANVGLAQPAFRGLMDEVSYYGSALSSDRVHNHYLADPPAPSRASGYSAQSGTVASPATTAPQSHAVAPGKRATDKAAKAKARARAKARAQAKAKALAKARARARARAKAKALAHAKARARAPRHAA